MMIRVCRYGFRLHRPFQIVRNIHDRGWRIYLPWFGGEAAIWVWLP